MACVDQFEDDQVGHIKLTQPGLQKTDYLAPHSVPGAGIPIVFALARGYVKRLDETAGRRVTNIEETLWILKGDQAGCHFCSSGSQAVVLPPIVRNSMRCPPRVTLVSRLHRR